MNRRVFGMFAMAAGAFLMPSPALAHHGRALIYDTNKETTVKATITEFVWSNPHVQIGIEAVDANGLLLVHEVAAGGIDGPAGHVEQIRERVGLGEGAVLDGRTGRFEEPRERQPMRGGQLQEVAPG